MKFWFAPEKVTYIRIVRDRFLIIGFDNSPHSMEIDFCADQSLSSEFIKNQVEAAYEMVKKSVIDSRS